jgi:CDP-diacylglycerol--serine O-phosphatidyltransferase
VCRSFLKEVNNLRPREKIIIGYFDIANLVSLGGMLLALASCFYALQGNLRMSVIFLGYSGICDLFDGLIARKIKRTDNEKAFGVHLDSLVDVVSFGVTPAVIVFSFAGMEWYALAIYAFYIIGAVVRLAYFNTIATGEKTKFYRGLPVTSIALILPVNSFFFFVYALPAYAWLITLAVTAVFFILNIKIPKPHGIWYIIFPAVAVAFTVLWWLQ